MASKYIDTISVMQVIGCCYNNPSLLDLTDKYTIIEEDFVQDFHKIVFGSILKLHDLGVDKITLENISDFLSSRPKSEAIFKLNKGEEWLIKISEKALSSSFDYYYQRLKKFTLLREYDKLGVDVTDIYDPDNLMDVRKKQVQEEYLDNSSLTMIADRIDNKISEIRMRYAEGDYNQALSAGEGIDSLIDRFKEHPEVGIPLYGSLVNTVTRGARLKKFYLRSAATGVGKAIPNETMIPTPIGWRQVKDIKKGDYLFGQDGKPTKVLKTYPQEKEKEKWRVTFSDGREAFCCSEHLWEYRYYSHRGFNYRVEDIQTIYNRTLKLKNGLKNSDGKGYRFHIKVNEPIEYAQKNFSLPPYVMGAFLGDGSFRYNETNKALTFSTKDEEILNYILKDLGKDNFIYRKSSDFNYNYTFKNKKELKHNIWVEEFLRDYPDLWNQKSETKFIPRDYLLGSIEQRYELLQGLMDTDGTIDEKGRTSFTTISPYLRDNIIELCRSLGFIVNFIVDKREEKYTTGECYIIKIQCKKALKPKLFKLKRKKDKAISYVNNGKREEFKDHLAITNIEKTSDKTEMTCFTVDNKDHLFLMNDFIVTHNTRAMIADVCYIGCEEIYDERFGWIRTGPGQPVLYISTEMELEEVQTMMIAFLSNVNEEHVLNGELTEEEEERCRKAVTLLKQAPIYVEELPDFSLQDVENTIKRNIRDNGVRYIFQDYLHTSLRILEEVSRRSNGVKLREDNVLFMLSTKLKDICNKYGVFILSATQLSGEFNESKTPDQNFLRGINSALTYLILLIGKGLLKKIS